MESWSISWAVRNLLSELLTPPGIWIVWVLLMLFLIKTHELIKKALIMVGLLLIWVTSTNYLAVQFTKLAGHWMNWPTHIYLVTHFGHMPRAQAFFEKEGLIVVPAPMGYYQKTAFTPLDFYPSSQGFQRIRWVWREIIGIAWAKLKFLFI